MIIVDSSVWISYFNGSVTPQTDKLDQLLGSQTILIGDLMMAEVLQGFRSDREFTQARKLLLALESREIVSVEIALMAAAHFRYLRKNGITVRKTIDTLIATYCIHHDLPLLHADTDFIPFEKHLGLRAVR